jgi:hypothetical protein
MEHLVVIQTVRPFPEVSKRSYEESRGKTGGEWVTKVFWLPPEKVLFTYFRFVVRRRLVALGASFAVPLYHRLIDTVVLGIFIQPCRGTGLICALRKSRYMMM